MKIKIPLLLLFSCMVFSHQLYSQPSLFAATGFGIGLMSQTTFMNDITPITGQSFVGGYGYRFQKMFEVSAGYKLFSGSNNQTRYANAWYSITTPEYWSVPISSHNLFIALNIYDPRRLVHFKIGHALGWMQHTSYAYSYYTQDDDFSSNSMRTMFYSESYFTKPTLGRGWILGSGFNIKLFERCKLTIDFDYYILQSKIPFIRERVDDDRYQKNEGIEDVNYYLFSANIGLRYFLK